MSLSLEVAHQVPVEFVRRFRRAGNSGLALPRAIDEAVAARVGLTPGQIEEMYHVMAIANYEDRFVIPTTHREVSEDAYDIRGSCGFSFGNGCSDGANDANLFGAPCKKTVRTPTETMS